MNKYTTNCKNTIFAYKLFTQLLMRKIIFIVFLSFISCSNSSDDQSEINNSDCSSSTVDFITELSNVSNLVEENPIDCLATNESLNNLLCIYSNLSENDIASLQVILSNEQEGLILEDALDELSIEIDTICN